MAASDAQLYKLSQDVTFQQRITVALEHYDFTVYTEDTATVNHVARAAFASLVVANPAAYAPELALLIASVDTASGTAYISTNPPSTDNITDAAIAADVQIAFPLLGKV